MQKITPFLWFDNNAEEAMNHYTSIFKDSKIVSVSRHSKGGSGPEGMLFTGTFEIEGQQFYVLNGGPFFKFTEAISLFVSCETQDEIDELWTKLSTGGAESRCGWLKDKFGLSWQIVPAVLRQLIGGTDKERSKRAMQAMMQMGKLDIAVLQKAYDGE